MINNKKILMHILIFVACFVFTMYGIKNIQNYKQTTCYIDSIVNESTKCCNKTNCLCEECNINLNPTCDNVLSKQINQTCCDGYYCCRMVYFFGLGPSDYECVKDVYNQRCEIQCEPCYNLTTRYYIYNNNKSIEKSESTRCLIDDSKCIKPLHKNITCYYNKNMDAVLWDRPHHNSFLVMFTLLSGYVTVLQICVFVVYIVCNLMNRDNYKYE